MITISADILLGIIVALLAAILGVVWWKVSAAMSREDCRESVARRDKTFDALFEHLRHHDAIFARVEKQLAFVAGKMGFEEEDEK
jgi:hypothetical protein